MRRAEPKLQAILLQRLHRFELRAALNVDDERRGSVWPSKQQQPRLLQAHMLIAMMILGMLLARPAQAQHFGE